MKLDVAVFRILGIKNADDPYRLLGISRWDGNVTTLEMALRVRLAQIISHPMRHSPEAKLVREAIKQAGRLIRKGCDQKEVEEKDKQEAVHELTDLDRSIIAVLVAEGGWNKQSRSRLVGVSAAYGLTVGGLLRILTALAESARSGRGPLSKGNRTSNTPNRSWTKIPTSPKQSVLDDLMDEAAARFLPEFKEQTPATVIKLSVLFGMLSIVAIVLGLIVLRNADTKSDIAQAKSAELLRINTAISSGISHNPTQQHKSPFSTYPTFKEVIFTQEIGTLVDHATEIPKTLITLNETITSAVARGVLVSKQVVDQWDESIQTLSKVWPFLDRSLQEETGELIVEIVTNAQKDQQLLPRLFSSFILKDTSRLQTQAMTTVQKPWLYGELARMTCSNAMLSSTYQKIKDLTDTYLLNCDIEETRRDLIRSEGVFLVQNTELDSSIFMHWEEWLAMVSREQLTHVADAIRVDVIQNILHSDIDLTRPSRTRKILGRFIKEVDWISTDQMRDSLLSFYLDPKISQVDMWAFTHLLNDAGLIPWLHHDHVVEIEDSFTKREIITKDLLNVWPSASKIIQKERALVLPAGYDPQLVELWRELMHPGHDTSIPSAKQFALARRLNEIAAAMWIGRPSRAWELIDNLDRSMNYDEELLTITPKSSNGQLVGRFLNIQRDQKQMMELLNFIRTSEYTTLHPTDASLLARTALFHRDLEIRRDAVSLICDTFSTSREIAIALVNVLTARAKTPQVDALVAYLTDDILPPRHDSFWLMEARRAFVQHALTAGKPELKALDQAVITAASSAIGEALLVDPTRIRPTHETTIEESYTQLVEAWNSRLGEPSILQRSFSLAGSDSILETHMKLQLQYLQKLQQLEESWSGSSDIQGDLEVLHESPTLIDQIRDAEFASLAIWHRLFNLASTEFQEQENQ